MGIRVDVATAADAVDLAAVAALTFPLACPPGATQENIAAFVASTLSERRFDDYLRDPSRIVLAARADDGRMLGYALLIRESADVIELSKMYSLADHHGAGVGAALMTAALEAARKAGATRVWLGVNQENQRAQRFYGKHGFEVTGTKTFAMGTATEHDFVMTANL